jgi:hypothetical protein
MAKASGLGDQFYIGGYDLSGEVSALGTVHGGNSPLDVTPINVSANVRLGGQRDGSIEFSTWMDTAAGHEHAALSPLPTADVIATYFRGAAIGNDCASQVSKQINYDWSRGTDGSLAGSVQCQANGFGLEWGTQHTAGIQTDTAATNSAGMDGLAQTAFGAQLYVHFFSVTGTSVTVKIQDFTSDTPASYVDVAGLTTTAVTPGQAPSAQRIAIANNATLRRWTRVVTVGTFSNAQFAVMLVRNPIAGQVF